MCIRDSACHALKRHRTRVGKRAHACSLIRVRSTILLPALLGARSCVYQWACECRAAQATESTMCVEGGWAKSPNGSE
eukprot:1411590-Alexandrium_andersonii.AAC.1